MNIPTANRTTASAALAIARETGNATAAGGLDLAYRMEVEAIQTETILWQVINLFARTDEEKTSGELHLSGADLIDALGDLFQAVGIDADEVSQAYPFGDALPSSPLVHELATFGLEVHPHGPGKVISIISGDHGENCGDISGKVAEAPFILVQRNRKSSPPFWVTAHETPEKAGAYIENEEYGHDWENETFFDRRNGDEYSMHTGVTFVKAS